MQELVKVALDRGSAKPETLTVALVISSADEKNASITEMLKKAGAPAAASRSTRRQFNRTWANTKATPALR